jgi:hypothetical protein
VAVVSAEVQEWEFVPLKLVGQPADFPLLTSKGETRWLGNDDARQLLDELTALVGDHVSPDDRLDLRRAAALVQYGLESGTGIAVAPPS